jgi:pimeloyl-ACP methyl ester carboxylesterase
MTILARDHLVPHRSTVPIIAGQTVNLFVRERSPERGPTPGLPPVVLVHGGFWPGTIAFDLPLAGYSLMEALARSGFATFAPDMVGYGRSPRPMMDDPANLSPEARAKIGIDPAAKPSYPFQVVTAATERDDLDAVIDFARAQTGAAKVLLFGWSGGGFRTGTYTALHPDKVEALVIQASSNFVPDGPDDPPPLPKPGAAFHIQDRAVGEGERWLACVRDAGQVEPHVPDLVWRESMLSDPLGATWGTGVLRSPARTYWGWNVRAAARVGVPTLIVVGEEDRLIASNRILFGALGSRHKVFVAAASATHFMLWERGRHFLAEAAREWFLQRTLRGATEGAFRRAPDDSVTAARLG